MSKCLFGKIRSGKNVPRRNSDKHLEESFQNMWAWNNWRSPCSSDFLGSRRKPYLPVASATKYNMVLRQITQVVGPGLTCSAVGCMTAIPITYCPPPLLRLPVQPWKQSYGMEQIWQAEFHSLFSQYYPHVWHLSTTEIPPVGQWNTFVDSAKVRFSCETCGHGWTSMKGRIAFWFYLMPLTAEGIIIFKLYGQRCDKCKVNRYEDPMWYPEEVHKVLVNAYHRVGQAYYGFLTPPLIKQRRAGKPRTPHNSDLCQACKDGVCAERK